MRRRPLRLLLHGDAPAAASCWDGATSALACSVACRLLFETVPASSVFGIEIFSCVPFFKFVGILLPFRSFTVHQPVLADGT